MALPFEKIEHAYLMQYLPLGESKKESPFWAKAKKLLSQEQYQEIKFNADVFKQVATDLNETGLSKKALRIL